jgi:hypothetical protein
MNDRWQSFEGLTMNEKIISRYLKVRNLALKGTEGEKNAASKILSRMEKKHPGVGAAADRKEPTAESTLSPETGPEGAWNRMTGNWENIFQYAAGVYQTVQEIVEEVSDVLQGQELADEEVIWRAGTSRKGFAYLSMRISLDAMFEARELTPAQQEMFKQALHTELERYLDSLLGISG